MVFSQSLKPPYWSYKNLSKFYNSIKGKQLASKILYGETSTSPSKSNDSDSSDTSSIENELAHKKSKTDEASTLKKTTDDLLSKKYDPAPLKASSNIIKTIKSSNVDSDLIEILDSDSDNDILIDDEKPKSTLIAKHSTFKSKTNNKSDSSDIVSLNDDDDDEPIIEKSKTHEKKSKTTTISRVCTSNYSDDDDGLPDIDIESCSQFKKDSSESVKPTSSSNNNNYKSRDLEELVELDDEPVKVLSKNFSKTTSTKATTLTQNFNSMPTVTTNVQTKSSITSISSSTYETGCINNDSSPPTPIVTLLPGTFEVILFVDNCEQSHA